MEAGEIGENYTLLGRFFTVGSRENLFDRLTDFGR